METLRDDREMLVNLMGGYGEEYTAFLVRVGRPLVNVTGMAPERVLSMEV